MASDRNELTKPILPGTAASDYERYLRTDELLALQKKTEEMLNFDERMQAFRFHHLKLAQRIIGGEVVGTMGTPVEILQQRMERGILYKALWEVRNEITAKMNAAISEDSKGHGSY